MRIGLRAALAACLFVTTQTLHGAELPHIRVQNGAGQLIVNGEPFLMLGGELGNSSAGTAAQADLIIPHLARMRVNTVLVPVAWEQIEPKEGSFDFSILDHWIDIARQHNVRLVLLWFGSWKNAFSNYAPSYHHAIGKQRRAAVQSSYEPAALARDPSSRLPGLRDLADD
jgi:beta-galactosidase GanA